MGLLSFTITVGLHNSGSTTLHNNSESPSDSDWSRWCVEIPCISWERSGQGRQPLVGKRWNVLMQEELECNEGGSLS